MDRLGLLGLIERWVRTGSANPGRKILTLVAAMLLAPLTSIKMLRAGGTGRVLGFDGALHGGVVLADLLLEAVLARTLVLGTRRRPRRQAADGRSGLHDLEVHGKHKGGAAYGYTKCSITR